MMPVSLLVSLAATLASASVLASEPGQPLDCNDWVILEPGITCTDISPPDCTDSRACNDARSSMEFDNAGNLLLFKSRLESSIPNPCGCPSMARTELVRYSLNTRQETVLAYVDDRCMLGVGCDRFRRREDFVQTYLCSLTYELDDGVFLHGELLWTDDDSNIVTASREAVYSYDRIVCSLGLTLEF